MRLSAIQLLLCMRRLMRSKLVAPSPDQCAACPARGERIEHAHLDVRVRGQRREAGVLGARIHVVEQQAHPHAAIGGLEQLLREVACRSGRRARCRSARRGCAPRGAALCMRTTKASVPSVTRRKPDCPGWRASAGLMCWSSAPPSAGAIAVPSSPAGRGGSCAHPPATAASNATMPRKRIASGRLPAPRPMLETACLCKFHHPCAPYFA